MPKKEQEQDQRIEQLKKINKKLNKKANWMIAITAVIGTVSAVFFASLLFQVTILGGLLLGVGIIGGSYAASVIASIRSFGNIDENNRLIEKLYIEKETRKLNEEDKKMIKEIAKDHKMVSAVKNISKFSLDKDQAELLKNTVLNKNVLQTITVLDQKDCIQSLKEDAFNHQKLEQEYNRAIEIGTKPKSLKKTMTEMTEMYRQK